MLVKTPTSNDAVLKIVRVDATATNEALTRAEREAALLASVSHPHIVKALSTSVSLGNPVYAICWLEEYLDGSDLRDLVGSPWAWPDVYDLGRDIADALADLHVRSVVHRDLSAGNVRRLSSGR
jgi:serine/threonine-protein kinase